MCGIAGIMSFNGGIRLSTPLKRMTDAMIHRGPDDEGFFLANNRENFKIYHGDDTPEDVRNNASILYCPQTSIKTASEEISQVALGYRRLSIIDLSPYGHQPMCTEDGRYWIVFNGEVYNFEEIRRDLESLGEQFISNSDSEVVLKAYREWGSDCLKRFNGMWAFAIWDNGEKKLFCARDRIGIKPFYYHLTDDFFLFASDIKTLIASGLYRAEPHWEGVYHAMSFYCAPRPMTCFKGINALEQAHWMVVGLEKRIFKGRYWRMPVGEINYKKTENQWEDELKYTLWKAVKRRLIADVPVGTFMSGGVDSTTVSAIAAQEHPGIKAFTLGYEDMVPEMDEVPQARATAAMWPMQHIVETIRPKTTIECIPAMVRCYEEPFHHLAPNFMISQLAKKNNVTVVLNGLGGDELFCGYGRQRWFERWQKIRLFSKIIDFAPDIHPKVRSLKNMAKIKDVYELYVRGFSIFSDADKKQLFLDNAAKNWDSSFMFKQLYELDGLPFEDNIEALGYMDIVNYIGNHHVYRADQFTMHFSLEGRFPFLDHELVELACRMPSRLKVSDGIGKYVLRNVAKELIHPSCLEMKKKGFGLPVGQWMRDELRDFVGERIAALQQRTLFSAEAIDGIKNDFYSREKSPGQLWFLVMLENWIEEFFKTKK